MQQVPSTAASDAAVYAFAAPHAFRPRTRLPARVVIAGASTTGLSALREVTLSHDYDVPRLTLLAPGGAAQAPALREAQLAAAVTTAGATVLDAALVSIDACAPPSLGRRLTCLCFVSLTVRVCVAFLLLGSVAVLLELAELAKPVEMLWLCCITG